MKQEYKKNIEQSEKLYIPQLIFGKLLTSSNYDDSKKRITGGKNGFGAKLTNIFSTKFVIDIVTDGEHYYQQFTNNMNNKTEPKII